MKTNQILAVLSALTLLSGCASTELALKKKNLDVQTKMSATLFLDHDEQASVYLQARNSSDKDFELTEDLRRALAMRGVRIVSTANRADYVLQVNVLQVGKFDQAATDALYYRRDYRNTGDTTTSVAAVAGVTNNQWLGGIGLLGDGLGLVADSTTKDVSFSAITDVQVKERLKNGKTAYVETAHYNKSGTSGSTNSFTAEKSNWRTYQTRVLSSATKVDLKFEQASPELKKSLVNSIAAIF